MQSIGEIVIVGTTDSAKTRFIQAVCSRVESADKNITFGQLTINDDLLLFLYGIRADNETAQYAWDLMARKMLGYVVLFDWYKEHSFNTTHRTLEYLTQVTDAPVVIAANVGIGALPLPGRFMKKTMSLSSKGQFVFYSEKSVVSVKKVLLTLIDNLIELY
jgi:hypothetical protein